MNPLIITELTIHKKTVYTLSIWATLNIGAHMNNKTCVPLSKQECKNDQSIYNLFNMFFNIYRYLYNMLVFFISFFIHSWIQFHFVPL